MLSGGCGDGSLWYHNRASNHSWLKRDVAADVNGQTDGLLNTKKVRAVQCIAQLELSVGLEWLIHFIAEQASICRYGHAAH